MSHIEDFQLSFYQEISKISERDDEAGSRVYLVKDTRDDRLYVKKHIKISELKVYQVIKEYQSGYGKKLEGIPKIFTIAKPEDELIVVEEYINHPTLSKVLETERITLTELAGIFVEICKTLQPLHSLQSPIIHRDIKPDNIIVNMDAVRGQSNDTKVYVIDWNAAREYSFSKSRDTQLMGTIEYAAPEQLGYGQSDVRTDVYGVGATLEYCLKHIGNIEEKDRTLYNRFIKLVEKAKALSPGDRFESGEKFIEAINDIFTNRTDESVEEDNDPTKKTVDYTLPGFRTKNPVKMFLSVLGYLFLVVIIRHVEIKAESNIYIIYQKICYFILLFSHPLWFCNYIGVQQKFEWINSGNVIQKVAMHVIVIVTLWGFWGLVSALPQMLGLLK